MNIEKIKDRVQKLLAMSKDASSPHEAAIAARRVQKIMAKYNLEMVDIIAEDVLDEDNITKAEVHVRYKRVPSYIQWIEVTVAQAFSCETKREYVVKNDVEYEVSVFYGYCTDVAIATSLNSYICNQLEALAKRIEVPEHYKLQGHSRRYMADWRKGAAKEICERVREFYGDGDQENLEPVTSAGQSLVSLKKERITSKFGQFRYNTTRSYRYTDDGMQHGRHAANSISVSKNVKNQAYALPDLT